MELLLTRAPSVNECTIGELSVNGEFECFTLEDQVRPVKVPGMTAIPAGHYEVVVTFSERFRMPMPLLLNVPNFDGIRIHVGNNKDHTLGCILVGTKRQMASISNSKLAYDALFPKIALAAQREKIFIEIVPA